MNINIGKRISQFRSAKGFSVNYLANQAGISQSYLREIELGKYNNPGIDTLDLLCNALGISLREFFDIDNEFQNIEDSLLYEISVLTPNQREQLRLFLKSFRDTN